MCFPYFLKIMLNGHVEGHIPDFWGSNESQDGERNIPFADFVRKNQISQWASKMVGNGDTKPVWFAKSTYCTCFIVSFIVSYDWLPVSLYPCMLSSLHSCSVKLPRSTARGTIYNTHTTRMTPPKTASFTCSKKSLQHMGIGQNPIPLVDIKIAGKWMFIPLKMVLIGIDP